MHESTFEVLGICPGHYHLLVPSLAFLFTSLLSSIPIFVLHMSLPPPSQCLKKWGFRRCEDICWVKTNIKNPGKKQHIDQKSIFQNTKVVSMLHDMCSQYSLYVCMVALVPFPGLPTIQFFCFFLLLTVCQNKESGPFYHIKDMNAYLQRGGPCRKDTFHARKHTSFFCFMTFQKSSTWTGSTFSPLPVDSDINGPVLPPQFVHTADNQKLDGLGKRLWLHFSVWFNM